MTKISRALFVLAVFALAAWAADPFAGTWQINLAKSKFNPGPPPKSITVTIEPSSKVTVQETSAMGESTTWSYQPVENGTAMITGMENSSVMEKRPNDRTIEHAWKFGEETFTGKAVLSKDGKTMTYTLTGMNSKGQHVHNVEVYDRQ
jgi:hypothetical protein